MQFSELGNTGLQVSKICLGTMTWGEQNTKQEAFTQMDMAMDAGINFFDTAELYPIPPKADSYGDTERYIGDWFQQRKNRDQIILASKVCGQANWIPHIRDGKTRFDHNNITAALDASLQRLKTDYIDLYQLHWPDRETNYFGKLGYTPPTAPDSTSLEETLAVLDELKKSGKIRHIGVSNETPWGVMKLINHSDQNDLPRIASIQNPYSLLNRSFEIGLAEIAYREKTGLLAYSPLGFGVLSGKYLENKPPENARLSLFKSYQRYSNDQGIAATKAYVALARKYTLDPAQMALAYVNSRPFTTSNIIGATNLDQLESNIASIDVNLSPELLVEIEEIHQQYPNPCP